MARKSNTTRLPAPFLKRLTLREVKADLPKEYPFDLPWLDDEFELQFDSPVTIFCGENGTGKSTLLEAIAALSGYDEAGGGKGYRPVDHTHALDQSGSALGDHLRAGWLPKVTDGWFFRAESFFSVARHLDDAAREAGLTGPDFLSYSHGEGFVRFFAERMARQGIYFMDEPESALSPKRQLELLRVLHDIQQNATSQVILATHSPLLMALPGAALWRFTHRAIAPIDYRETEHFRLYQSFATDPDVFINHALRNDLDGIL